MTNVSRYNFSNSKQITALVADSLNDFLWVGYAKNSSDQCILQKQSWSKPDLIFFTMERTVDEIVAMTIDANNVYVVYDDSDSLGEIFAKSNPLTSTTDISKGSYNESPVDIAIDGTDLWFLLPGEISGENAKLLKYNTSGTFQLEIDLTNSAKMVKNAKSMTVVDGDIYIGTNTDPAQIVRVFEVSEDTWDFTIDESLI